MKCIPIGIILLLSSCGNENAQTTIDSISKSGAADSVVKTDTLIPMSDSTLPFEQDTQKIIETLDLLDSIRQAKYN
jgi:hypothetical protein